MATVGEAIDRLAAPVPLPRNVSVGIAGDERTPGAYLVTGANGKPQAMPVARLRGKYAIRRSDGLVISNNPVINQNTTDFEFTDVRPDWLDAEVAKAKQREHATAVALEDAKLRKEAFEAAVKAEAERMIREAAEARAEAAKLAPVEVREQHAEIAVANMDKPALLNYAKTMYPDMRCDARWTADRIRKAIDEHLHSIKPFVPGEE